MRPARTQWLSGNSAYLADGGGYRYSLPV